jgi:hypothetical protein
MATTYSSLLTGSTVLYCTAPSNNSRSYCTRTPLQTTRIHVYTYQGGVVHDGNNLLNLPVPYQ